MKSIFRKLFIIMCIFILTATTAGAVTTLVPGGQVIGLQLQDNTITVAALENNTSGLMVGDRLIAVNGKQISSVLDIKEALSQGAIRLTILRKGKGKTLEVQGPKLGVYLRQGTTGLGTVTYYNPEKGTYGALGHGVCTPEGMLTQLEAGEIYNAQVYGVEKGKCGSPGRLLGNCMSTVPTGSLEKNTNKGVFGKTHCLQAEPLPVAEPRQVKPGKASIYATVSGTELQEYSVEILKIYSGNSDTRNMLLQVTDPELLETTGGIVQGMSGSPIIQDGKLVGAVTHVLVNDPTMGYGIFIENMLDAAA